MNLKEQAVLIIEEHKLHQDLVNVIGLNISSGILLCAGMVNEKLLSQKKILICLSKEELIELVGNSWDKGFASRFNYTVPNNPIKEQFINNLLNQ